MVQEGGLLTFVSTLADALHSQSGTHPLHLLAKAMSDQHLCDELECNFERATAADSPAMMCSLRAVQVLLSRLCTYWKVSAHNNLSSLSPENFLFCNDWQLH